MSHDFAVGMFNSCRDVQMPSTNERAIALLCGHSADACTPQNWLDYMGNTGNMKTPFTVSSAMMGLGRRGGGWLWYVCMGQGWGLLNIAQDEACIGFVAEEMWESGCGCPGLLVPDKPRGFFGCEVTLKRKSLGYLIRKNDSHELCGCRPWEF